MVQAIPDPMISIIEEEDTEIRAKREELEKAA